MRNIILNDFIEAQKVLEQFVSNSENITSIENAALIMVNALREGKKIMSCGNGGSMCDAMHFAEELTGRFRGDRPALAALAISDPTHMSCTANDYSFDSVFSRYVEALGQPGDVLLAISTSGNSANVVKAALTAKERGILVVALTGNQGGKLAAIANAEIRAPQSAYSDRVQEIHIKAIHSIIHYIEEALATDK